VLKNYIKIALRNLWKHKGYSFINIAGLAVGVACALFILLWVQDEFSANSCHVNARRIYRVEQDQHGDAGAFHVNVTPYPMGPSLKAEIPEVEQAVRWTSPGTLLVRYGDKAFFESGARAVDPEVFRVFTFPLVRGEAEKALARPGSVVLTEELARKYFGTENPLGQIITIDNAYPFTVTAVMKTAPLNSMVRPDMLVQGLVGEQFDLDLGHAP
jgi:putative ABC transport system permease protein